MKRIAQIKADDSPTDVCGRYPFVSVSSATSAFQRLPFLDVFTNRKNIGWYGENTDQRFNGPIELWSNEVFNQKIAYIHNNPVVAGFVNEADDWRLSSAIDYAGGKGVLDIKLIE